MKEKENGNNNDLTRQPNSPNLEVRRDIFMADENGENAPQTPEETAEHLGRIKAKGESSQEQRAESASGGQGAKSSPSSPAETSDQMAESDKEVAKLLLEMASESKKTDDVLSAAIDDPELKKLWEESGVPVGDLETLKKRIFDQNELQEATRRNIEQRMRAAITGENKERQPIYIPKSLEELAVLVMNMSGEEYRKGGDKYLLKEDGSVDTLHFLDWARNNYYQAHLTNPTSQVNFFSDIATTVRGEGFGSPINFYEITYTKSYFLKEKRDPQTGDLVKYENSDEYEALRDQMLMEVFLLQLQRNPAVNYILASRPQKDKMLQALSEAMVLNPLTRGDFMERIFTAPSMNNNSIVDFDPKNKGRELQAKREGNFGMGTATREAIATYMNIFDYDQLVTILGEDSPLFTYEYEKWDAWNAKKNEGDLDHTAPDPKNPDKRKGWYYSKEDVEKLKNKGITVAEGRFKIYKFDKNGDLVLDKDGKPIIVKPAPDSEFMRWLNIFLTPSPDPRQQHEIRERIVLSIMERNKISYREAQIAELMAFSMAEINGVAARMDIDSVAFDYWTRLLNFRDKRKREKSPSRNSPYGSNFNMEGFKRIGLTFFEAARDLRGKSIRRIILGGEGKNINIQGDALKNKVSFETEDGKILFTDKDGNQVDLNVYSYKIDQEEKTTVDRFGKEHTTKVGKIRYLDRDGREVDVGESAPKIKVEEVEDKPIFAQDLQKQFMPNHLITGTKIYEWVTEGKEFDLPSIVTGRDARGYPIIDWKKVAEIKDGPEHDIRYMISTWGQINFGERHVEWERLEERRNGKLVDDQGRILDDDWYILNDQGKRTGERSDPKTSVRSREMTVLESMFDAEALEYIQFEIERKGIAKGENFIQVRSEKTGKEVKVDISDINSKEFRESVWQGAFEYLIAKEIEAHRTRGSGYRYYDFEDTMKAKEALEIGQILEVKQADYIAKQEKITDRRMFSEALGYSFAEGSMAGGFNALKLFIKGLIS
jgi:hypothetical protein